MSKLSYRMFSNGSGKLAAATVKGAKNTAPIPGQWDGVCFLLSDLPANITSYNRVTIRAKYFNASGAEISQNNGLCMVVVIYDLDGDLKGPDMGAGKNTPLKQFNVGTNGPGDISKDNGSRIVLTQAPNGVLLQASNPSTKFVEVTEITFHN